MTTWLAGAHVVDLHPAIGNGPFADCYGVILHVNVDEAGTPDSFWGNGNPGQVCPNFQVFKDGRVSQMLPLNWQPWCQIDGNYHYAAIETAGLPSEPLTAAQISAIATIMRTYHEQLGVPLQIANAPGERGLGLHSMGGQAWGGHACPGDIRAGQRAAILAAAAGTPSAPTAPDTHPTAPPTEEEMPNVLRVVGDGDFIVTGSVIRRCPVANGGKGVQAGDVVKDAFPGTTIKVVTRARVDYLVGAMGLTKEGF